MATYTKEILKEGAGPGIRVGQQVTVEVRIVIVQCYHVLCVILSCFLWCYC